MAEDDAAGEEPTEGGGAGKPAGGLAATVKAWSDAVSAAMKAALFAAAALVVAAVVVATVSREHGRRAIAVEVDDNAIKLLRDRGADIDLHDALVGDLAADIAGIEAFIRVSLFNKVALTGNGEPVSLKSLGVDVTTDEIDRLYRLIFGAPEPFKVRVGLLCPAGACEPGAAGGAAGDPKQLLTLLVELRDGERSQRLSFRVPPANPGLQRGLRRAMQSASETLMEQIDPLLASLLYLNLPETTIFEDERRRYGRLGAAATALVGADRKEAAAEPARACMAEIVFYGSIARSAGDWQGMDEAVAAASREGAPATCQYAAKTTVALRRVEAAQCNVNWRVRRTQIARAREEMSGMDALAARLEGQELDEIRQRQLAMRLQLAIADASGKDGSWAGLCLGGFVPWDGKPAPFDLAPFAAVAHDTEATFAARHGIVQTHALVHIMSFVFPLIPRGALVERDAWAQTVARLAAEYVPGDPAPRLLLAAWARALTEQALVRVDAMRLSDEDLAAAETRAGVDPATSRPAVAADALNKFRLARIAFEDASATASASMVAEPYLELDPLVAAADAAAEAGAPAEARSGYARAVQTFVDRDEPPREIVGVGRAAAHWLAALADAGACAPGAARDAEWDRTWLQLGARPDHPMCDLSRPGPAADTAGSSGLLEVVRPIAAASAGRCPRRQPAAKTAPTPDLDAVERLRCMADYEKGAAETFTQTHSGLLVEQAIEKAIAAP